MRPSRPTRVGVRLAATGTSNLPVIYFWGACTTYRLHVFKSNQILRKNDVLHWFIWHKWNKKAVIFVRIYHYIHYRGTPTTTMGMLMMLILWAHAFVYWFHVLHATLLDCSVVPCPVPLRSRCDLALALSDLKAQRYVLARPSDGRKKVNGKRTKN